MKKILAIVCILAILLCSCSKTEYLHRVEVEDGGGYIMERYTDETMTTMTGLERYDANDVMQLKVEHSFDKKGNRTKTVQYDEDLNIVQTIEWSYDKNGNNTVISWKDQSSTETARIENDYDDNGIITESRTYYGDFMESKTEYKSDGTGNEFGLQNHNKTEYNMDGTVKGYIVEEFDSAGYQTYKEYTPDWIIQYSRQYTPDGPIEIYYDENGNVKE